MTADTNSSKHTPAPWRVVAGSTLGFKTASGGESILADARPTDDFFVLKIAEMDTNVGAAERAANASLIAAAPDMYEAIQNALGLLDNAVARRRHDGDAFYADVVTSLRAALAKAEAV